MHMCESVTVRVALVATECGEPTTMVTFQHGINHTRRPRFITLLIELCPIVYSLLLLLIFFPLRFRFTCQFYMFALHRSFAFSSNEYNVGLLTSVVYHGRHDGRYIFYLYSNSNIIKIHITLSGQVALIWK